MRRRFPDLACAQYPYISESGFSRYRDHREMTQWLKERLRQFVPEEKIFTLPEDL